MKANNIKQVFSHKPTHKAVLQRIWTVGEHAFKSYEVKHLVDSVVCSNDANISVDTHTHTKKH